jgi:hypothetical protein
MDWNAAGFFVFFAVMWLIVTTILAVLSGWFRLMEAFPDQPSDPILRLRAQSGRIGPLVSMSGVLTLSVCTAGLRVGMMRLFGPFCRDFLVPWQSIAVVRKSTFFGPVAQLQFGDPAVGELRIAGHVADRLASAAMEHWPEGGSIPPVKRSDIARRYLGHWAIATLFGALFFGAFHFAVGGPPLLVAVLLPAVVYGIGFLVRYLIVER